MTNFAHFIKNVNAYLPEDIEDGKSHRSEGGLSFLLYYLRKLSLEEHISILVGWFLSFKDFKNVGKIIRLFGRIEDQRDNSEECKIVDLFLFSQIFQTEDLETIENILTFADNKYRQEFYALLKAIFIVLKKKDANLAQYCESILNNQKDNLLENF